MTSHVIKTANGEVRVAKDSSELILVQAYHKETTKIFKYFKHLAKL